MAEDRASILDDCSARMALGSLVNFTILHSNYFVGSLRESFAHDCLTLSSILSFENDSTV